MSLILNGVDLEQPGKWWSFSREHRTLSGWCAPAYRAELIEAVTGMTSWSQNQDGYLTRGDVGNRSGGVMLESIDFSGPLDPPTAFPPGAVLTTIPSDYIYRVVDGSELYLSTGASIRWGWLADGEDRFAFSFCSCREVADWKPYIPPPAPASVTGWTSGAGGVTGDASAVVDGDLLSGDGTGYFIARFRGSGGGVWMYWPTPVSLTSYTMRQGFSPEDAQYGLTALVRAGWRLYASNYVMGPFDDAADVPDFVEIENAEGSASVQDSVHVLGSPGAYRVWYWTSTIQDPLGAGALQVDWLIREIEIA